MESHNSYIEIDNPGIDNPGIDNSGIDNPDIETGKQCTRRYCKFKQEFQPLDQFYDDKNETTREGCKTCRGKEKINRMKKQYREVSEDESECSSDVINTRSRRVEPKKNSLIMDRMLLQRQRGRCRGGELCPLPQQDYSLIDYGPCYENDHRISLQREGVNEIHNRQLLCGICHTRKSAYERPSMRNELNPEEEQFLSRLEKSYSPDEMDNHL